jgi:trehalose-6-phosphate synthase
MPPEERKARMQRMRAVVQENNVYRWAGDLIGELAAIRLALPGGWPVPIPSLGAERRRGVRAVAMRR